MTSFAADRARSAGCRAGRRSTAPEWQRRESSIRSGSGPCSCAASSRRSTSASMRGCMARKVRGVHVTAAPQKLADTGMDRRVVENKTGGMMLA